MQITGYLTKKKWVYILISMANITASTFFAMGDRLCNTDIKVRDPELKQDRYAQQRRVWVIQHLQSLFCQYVLNFAIARN